LVISGCIGWYDSLDLTAMAQNSDGTGAVAVGDQVGYWKDKSTTAAHVTQGVGANRPTLTSNQVNGRAALRFDGSNDTLSKTSGYTLQNSVANLTRIGVFSSSQNCIVSTTGTSGNTAFQLFSSRIYTYTAATPVNVQVADGGGMLLRIYASVFDNSVPSLNILFNNVTQSIVATAGTLGSTTGNLGSALHIGSNSASNQFVNGPIAEYLVYNRTLSAGELTAVYRYLRKKWGFA
jgi:hypothetical protein